MRRKQRSVFGNGTPFPHKQSEMSMRQSEAESYYQPHHRKMSSNLNVPDSLERFQQEIQRSLLAKQQSSQRDRRMNRRRVQTQVYDNEEEDSRSGRGKEQNREIQRLTTQVSELKNQLKSVKTSSKFQDKLDQLMQEMAISRQVQRQAMLYKQNQTPAPMFYPPPYYPDYPPSRRNHQTQYNQRPRRTNFPKSPSRYRRLLRKYFFAVAFPIFLKSDAKKLAQRRKINLRTFYMQKFNPQMLQLKNWLVEGLSFSIPVILEKQKLSLKFWEDNRPYIAKQKESLLIKIVKIGLRKMKDDCLPQKISFFAQILNNLCSGGSFAMSRFWSAFQMRSICISEYFGCIRADQSLQKFLVYLVVMIKMLVFNLLLQPYKFDSTNFPKRNKPLLENMHVIASVFYKLAKQLIQEYIDEPRPKYYKLGNWLSVREQFIVECCQPLHFNGQYPQENEWISGMIVEELSPLQESNGWPQMVNQMRQIVDILCREMRKRRKDVVRNQKYKLNN